MHNAESKQRARTSEEKQFRRRAILDAARSQFAEVGYEAFSMARLAKGAGLAKGTLYLYFGTREEVFLELHNELMTAWENRFLKGLLQGMTDEALIRHFWDSAKAEPLMIPLLVRLDHVIEHNVSIKHLITSKRLLRDLLERVSLGIAAVLELEPGQAADLVRGMASLLIGTAHIDQGPNLEDEEIPSDVREIINDFSSDDIFERNAARILAGIRARI